MTDLTFSATQADYAVLEAHRQRPPVCSAPSLIWHIAVAPEETKDPQGAQTQSEYNERIQIWSEGVNRTIKRLSQLSFNSEDRFPVILPQSQDGILSINSPVTHFYALWMGVKIETIIEIHFDFVSFTFVIDLRSQGGEAGNLIESLKEKMSTLQTANAAEVEKATTYLVDEIWLNFRKDVLAAANEAETVNLFPGLPFAKFSGLVLEEDIPDGWDSTDRFDHPGDENKNGVAILKKRWPIILAANASADDRDIVATYMLGKRAIYVTAMGAQTKKSFLQPRHYSDVQPVRYIIFVRKNADKYQIGRLVEHINTMGSFRLIALKELALFRQMGTSIRIYGHLIDAASKKFNELITYQSDRMILSPHPIKFRWDSEVGNELNPLTYIERTDDIRRLQNALCGIQAQIYLDASRFTGGLTFRVSRASYYVNIIRQRMPDLNIERIAPYQAYDAFVRRRLFSVFDYITDIGQRASRLSDRISRLLDAIQAKALVDLTYNIQHLNASTALQTRELAKISSDTARQSIEEQKQTTVLYVIALFAFVGQLLIAFLWGSGYFEYTEEEASLRGYAIAFFIGVTYYLWRRRRDNAKAKRTMQEAHELLSESNRLQ